MILRATLDGGAMALGIAEAAGVATVVGVATATWETGEVPAAGVTMGKDGVESAGTEGS